MLGSYDRRIATQGNYKGQWECSSDERAWGPEWEGEKRSGGLGECSRTKGLGSRGRFCEVRASIVGMRHEKAGRTGGYSQRLN